MTSEAISEALFLREYTRELHNRNAAVFAGAGLSVASGYVDWKGLLKEIIEDLKLDPAKEYDLVTLAQYHCNEAGGSKTRLTQTIFNHFAPTKKPTRNHEILSTLPIQTYWTTNYDKLIEKALEEAKKVPDVKYTSKQLAITRRERDVVVYKMHGDIDHASDAIITKDDYEAYPLRMNAFMSALGGDLIEKTFLFVGFSFTDPNIDYILSRVRVQYEEHQRHHYCILRKVSKDRGETRIEFEYRQRKQEYFIRDLKRFHVYTVLVDEFSDITRLLQALATKYKRSSIFISGAADDFGTWSRKEAEQFLHNLSYELLENKNRVITGFGKGVGGPVVNGSLAYLDDNGRTVSDEYIVMRPFPLLTIRGPSWTKYRKEMFEHAGIALFVFGNRKNDEGSLEFSEGVREEFNLCVEAGVMPIPIGATGFISGELWNQVWSDFDRFYPTATAKFRNQFKKLGSTGLSPTECLEIVLELIGKLRQD